VVPVWLLATLDHGGLVASAMWTLPGEGRSLGLWRAQDAAGMQAILASLPLNAWMTVQTAPLTRHPSDPATAKT